MTLKNMFGNWLRLLDESLEIESRLADLYRHNATAGSVREFLIKGLLERFLPSIVTVETGKVIDSYGGMSKQIDIILFDSRVPCLRSTAGIGMFPVEGVLGTIAVKTSLSSKDDVIDALENCLSVIALTGTGDADFDQAVQRKVSGIVQEQKLSHLEAYIRAVHFALPPTYVFAIRGGLSASGLCDAVDAWFHRSKDFQEIVPAVPRMILAGHQVGFVHDGINTISPPAETQEAAIQECGPGGRVLMAIWPYVQHRWSFLASHVLQSVSYRLGIANDYLQARYAIDRYMPAKECFEAERLQDVDVDHVLWNGEFPRFRSCFQMERL